MQIRPERIGPTLDAVREALAWLGDCARNRAGHSTHLIFRFAPETAPDTELNLKVEINTREHTNVLGLKTYAFELANGWHHARADIVSFEPEELLGTKPPRGDRSGGEPPQEVSRRGLILVNMRPAPGRIGH